MSLVDSADLTIGSTFGNKLLERYVSFEINDAATREPFTPVGKQRPVGSTRKPGEQTIDIELMPDTTEEVPWHILQASGEIITCTVQYRGGAQKGQRWQYRCQVSERKPPAGDNEGKYTASVKLLVIGEGKKLS